MTELVSLQKQDKFSDDNEKRKKGQFETMKTILFKHFHWAPFLYLLDDYIFYNISKWGPMKMFSEGARIFLKGTDLGIIDMKIFFSKN